VTKAVYEKPDGACSYGACLKTAIEGGRCGRHHRFVYKSCVKFGGESREKVQRVPFGTDVGDPRETLIEALEGDDALAVVDAIDAYLEETDPSNRSPGLQWSPNAEFVRAIRERDEALARAEKAERGGVQGAPAGEDEGPQPPEPPPAPSPTSSAHAVDPMAMMQQMFGMIQQMQEATQRSAFAPSSTAGQHRPDAVHDLKVTAKVAAISLRAMATTFVDVAVSKLVAAVDRLRKSAT
jgi:hypothetical protein